MLTDIVFPLESTVDQVPVRIEMGEVMSAPAADVTVPEVIYAEIEYPDRSFAVPLAEYGTPEQVGLLLVETPLKL